jgi:predicted permease
VTGNAAQVMVLQMGMPPALATLVIAETFNLDRDLAVTILAMGMIVLLFTLPMWLWLF